jgi:hypothetical protein
MATPNVSEYADEDAYFSRQRSRFIKSRGFEIARPDAVRFALQSLRQYQNVEAVTKSLIEIHSVPSKYSHFAKLQAESIRYCLQQFLEYYSASKSGPYSRPTLMYYAVMYLATVEILWKLDGRYSLQRLRQLHPHHGLEFSIDGGMKKHATPEHLRCKIAAFGTFTIWNRIVLDGTLIGESQVHEATGGIANTLRNILTPPNKAFDFRRANLYELAVALPTTWERLTLPRSEMELVRATVKQTVYEIDKKATFEVIVHPDAERKLTRLYEQFNFRIGCVTDLNIRAFRSGLGISMDFVPNDFRNVDFPSFVNIERALSLFRSKKIELNEFGVIYVITYIAGMFARYYPEYWAASVDRHDTLSQVTFDCMDAAEERAPLLLLGELTGTEYILK